MANDLTTIYEELLATRKYLIKKGQSRYTCSVTVNKFEDAKRLYNNAKLLLSKIKANGDPALVTSFTATFNQIHALYLEISQLCTIPSEQKIKLKMEFDIRTACNLIPLLDDKEATTKRLIDAVEMYAEMLDNEGKSLLIKFVLKGRLSENAKLRLSNSYSEISGLITDLRKHLLTTKSFTAIQSQLQNTNQGWRSLDEYGTEIEKLFTDLTISQADGNSAKYAVLKPLNEKMAVKIFSNGLKNSRTSTIVAARNYDSLKDAIQAAKDEEVTMPSTSSRPDVLQYSRGGRGKYRSSSNPRQRGYQGRYSHPRGCSRGYPRMQAHQPATFRSDRGRYYYNTRAYSPRQTSRRGQSKRNIYSVQPTDGNGTNDNVNGNNNDFQNCNPSMQFFRN